jgi:hypothetical protein
MPPKKNDMRRPPTNLTDRSQCNGDKFCGASQKNIKCMPLRFLMKLSDGKCYVIDDIMIYFKYERGQGKSIENGTIISPLTRAPFTSDDFNLLFPPASKWRYDFEAIVPGGGYVNPVMNDADVLAAAAAFEDADDAPIDYGPRLFIDVVDRFIVALLPPATVQSNPDNFQGYIDYWSDPLTNDFGITLGPGGRISNADTIRVIYPGGDNVTLREAIIRNGNPELRAFLPSDGGVGTGGGGHRRRTMRRNARGNKRVVRKRSRRYKK